MTLQDFGLQRGMVLYGKAHGFHSIRLLSNDVIEKRVDYGANPIVADVERYLSGVRTPANLTVGFFEGEPFSIDWGDLWYVPLTASNYDLLPAQVRKEIDAFPDPTLDQLDELETNLNSIGWSSYIKLGASEIGFRLVDTERWLEAFHDVAL